MASGEYSKPKLNRYGDVAEITKGEEGGSGDGLVEGGGPQS